MMNLYFGDGTGSRHGCHAHHADCAHDVYQSTALFRLALRRACASPPATHALISAVIPHSRLIPTLARHTTPGHRRMTISYAPLLCVQEVRHELGLPVGRLAMLNAHREDKVGIGEALKPLQACMVGGEFDEDAFLCICAPPCCLWTLFIAHRDALSR